MNTLNAVLIDDESKLLEVLRMKLEAVCPNVKVVGTASNAKDGYNLIIQERPDIVFLDIGMPGESGFDMLKRFDSIKFELIFVTGYNEYGLEAIKYSAIGYLLKPISSEELVLAVKRAEERANMKITHERYKYFLEQIKNPSETPKRLGIPTDLGLEFVQSGEIIRCEATNRQTHIHLSSGDKLTSTQHLAHFTELLSKYNYFRPHKSHLINMSKLLKYDKDGVLIMTDGSMVPLARRKKSEFLQLVEKINK